MNERGTLTRRELFENLWERAKQTAIVAPILVACSPVSSGSTEASKTPDSIEQKVKSAGVSEWKKMLSQNSTVPNAAGGFDISFSTSILNPNTWNDKLFEQLVAGQKIKDSLRVKWAAVTSKTDPQNGQAGFRWFGEAEFSNVSLTLASGSPSGESWTGIIRLNFDERGHSVYESPGFGWVKDKSRFQNWMSSAPKEFDQPLESLKPSPSHFEFSLTLANGRIQKISLPWDLNYFAQGSTDIDMMARRFYLPSTFLVNGCKPETNCRRVNLNLT